MSSHVQLPRDIARCRLRGCPHRRTCRRYAEGDQVDGDMTVYADFDPGPTGCDGYLSSLREVPSG